MINKRILAICALFLGALQAGFNDNEFGNRALTVGETLQVCKDVSFALSNYTGMELCEALKQPYSLLRGKDFSGNDTIMDEIVRLRGHLEMLTDSWRLETALADPSREYALFWGFTLTQTKKMASIQAEVVLAWLSYGEGVFTVELDAQEIYQRQCIVTEALLKRVDFAIAYLKALVYIKSQNTCSRNYFQNLIKELFSKFEHARINENEIEDQEFLAYLKALTRDKQLNFESKDARISHDEIDEQEFLLAIELTLEMFNEFLEKRIVSDEVKALYEDRVRAVLQELESLYVPAAKA